MSLYPLVQLRRAAKEVAFDRAGFCCSVKVTQDIAVILDDCEYLKKVNGELIESITSEFSEFIGKTIKLVIKPPRTSGAKFYQNFTTFLDSFIFDFSKESELPEFYLFEEDLYFSNNKEESDDDQRFIRLKELISKIPKFESLAHYHDKKMGDTHTLVYLSGEHRSPIVLDVKISEKSLSKDINFSLLEELTLTDAEMHIHYSDKRSVFYSSLHEFLNGVSSSSTAFGYLIESWESFVSLYQNNLSTYLSGFSFHKAKKEVVEAEIELSEKLTNLTSDIVFKLFSVPASIIALAAIMQRGTLDGLVLFLLFIGVAVTILLMHGLLQSQKNKYESLNKVKGIVFSSIDGKESEYPEDLNTEIIDMKKRLDNHFESTKYWLRVFKIAIFSPLIALVIFIISA